MNIFEKFVRFLADDPSDADCNDWCERVGAKMHYHPETYEHYTEYTYENIAKTIVSNADKDPQADDK